MRPWPGWLFIGGSTDWKLGPGAVQLIHRAQDNYKRVHVGRVNSGRRFARFAALGCDTADGTHISFLPPESAAEVRRWMRAAAHPRLFEV